MEIDDYQDESILTDINNINFTQSSNKMQSTDHKKRNAKKSLKSCINETNLESLLKSFGAKFAKIFSQNKENLKMLKLTLDEEALDFEEIPITLETMDLPAFENFKSLMLMFQEFFEPGSNKNFFQLFISCIDLLNFFSKDLFCRQKIDYFISDEHITQPKIKEFIRTKIIEDDNYTKEISVFYSLTEKIIFGLSEDFLIFGLNENNENQVFLACYAHLIRVYLGYFIVKIQYQVYFAIENFESFIIEEETQKHEYHCQLKKCEGLLDLIMRPNWEKVRKVSESSLSAFGDSVGYEQHNFFNRKKMTNAESILVSAKEINNKFIKSNNSALFNIDNNYRKAKDYLSGIKLEYRMDEEENFNQSYAKNLIHSNFNFNSDDSNTKKFLNCDYKIFSWAEYFKLLSFNINMLKKKCKMEKAILEIITLIAVKTFPETYLNLDEISEEDTIHCIQNATRENALSKLRLIFYDYLNDLDVDKDIEYWKVHYIMNIFSSNEYLNHYFESLIHQCTLEIVANKIKKIEEMFEEFKQQSTYEAKKHNNFNANKSYNKSLDLPAIKKKILTSAPRLFKFLRMYEWNPKNYFKPKDDRRNMNSIPNDDIRNVVLEHVKLLKIIVLYFQE